jgi:hypothetical protein
VRPGNPVPLPSLRLDNRTWVVNGAGSGGCLCRYAICVRGYGTWRQPQGCGCLTGQLPYRCTRALGLALDRTLVATDRFYDLGITPIAAAA